jgi:exopolysaccharide biosynthesis protein
MKRKGFWFVVAYAAALTAFTVYLLLDTFVIARVYGPVVPITPTFSTSPTTPTSPTVSRPVITENSYRDENISITLTTHRHLDTSIYVADIRIQNPQYLKTALAKDTYGRNIKQTTSEMAESHNAILAINGDYYGSRDKGYVLRNGQLFREKGSKSRQDLVIRADGSFEIIAEKDVSAQSLLADGAWQVLSFGPALVMDGKVAVDHDAEVGQATYSNPRTAIAVVDELHYLMVVSDGRTDRSAGLSLYELAQFMQSLGAATAYNLDGGGSSTMWFNGRVVNEPVNHGSTVSERSISDIVYIGY